MIRYITGILFFFLAGNVFSQISIGGVPASFSHDNLQDHVRTIVLDKPEITLEADKDEAETSFKPELAGIGIKTDINLMEDGTEARLDKQIRVVRLRLECEGAKALGLYYSRFYLPRGVKLFIYNDARTKLIGAFTAANNPENGLFATELIPGESLILELELPSAVYKVPEIVISDVAYIIKGEPGRNFGDSGPCEVNVNCPEGTNWQNQRNGIARILCKESNTGLYWCTGSLINNTNLDNTPYFLTANHCGENSTTSDYNLWIFYFNYQTDGCPNPSEEPASNTITGASLLAKSQNGTSYGSDFKLLLLNNNPPQSYNPYYNGWDRTNNPSPNGVGIHHPQGDIKKISTYTSPLISTWYDGNSSEPEEKFWKVVWSETETNHGVTEGGSSGSPIFSDEGLIVGALTGGAASCTYLTGPDYYGKIWFSWDLNGDDAEIQLKPWLDPQNLGLTSLEGMSFNADQVIALFKAERDTIQVGASIGFSDLSSGNPTKWNWYFEGGEPETSTAKNPKGITYKNFGSFDVRLIVMNDRTVDTLLEKDLITVRPVVGPNPSGGNIEIFLGDEEIAELRINLYNTYGRKVSAYSFSNHSGNLTLDLGTLDNDIYFLEVINQESVSLHKVLLVR